MTNVLAQKAVIAKVQTLDADEMVRLFNRTFLYAEQTELVMNGSEPLYLPAAGSRPYHRIVFAHDYVRSALHEISHWCVAGKVRRHLLDYGYWYAPDGRNAEQQATFLKMEVKPQAYEWLLSICAGVEFEVSLDNLNANIENRAQQELKFTEQVLATGLSTLRDGLPKRLQKMCNALCEYNQQPLPKVAEVELLAKQTLNETRHRLMELL